MFNGIDEHRRAWLALIALAEAANPQGINAGAARSYLQQQMSPGAMIPTQEQLHGIMGSILSMLNAFPGQSVVAKSTRSVCTLRDSIVNIMHDRAPGTEPDLNAVVDQVQELLPPWFLFLWQRKPWPLGPMLQNMQASNPGGPDLAPALRTIMDGFRSLNTAIATAPEVSEAQSMDT